MCGVNRNAGEKIFPRSKNFGSLDSECFGRSLSEEAGGERSMSIESDTEVLPAEVTMLGDHYSLGKVHLRSFCGRMERGTVGIELLPVHSSLCGGEENILVFRSAAPLDILESHALTEDDGDLPALVVGEGGGEQGAGLLFG